MSDRWAWHAAKRSRGSIRRKTGRRKAGHSWSVGMANPVKLPELRIEPEFKNATIEPKSVDAGDLVQWTSGGVDQFETPRRVQSVHRLVTARNGHSSKEPNTGVPLSELTRGDAEVRRRFTASSTTAPPDPITVPSMNKEREYLRGVLSRDAGYRLLVSGDIGPEGTRQDDQAAAGAESHSRRRTRQGGAVAGFPTFPPPSRTHLRDIKFVFRNFRYPR